MGQVTNKVSPPDWPKVWAGARERLRKDLGRRGLRRLDRPAGAGLGGTGRGEHRRAQAVRAQLGGQPLRDPDRAGAAGRGGEPASLSIVLAPGTPAPSIGAGAERATVTETPMAAPAPYLRTQPDSPAGRRAAAWPTACCIRRRPSRASCPVRPPNSPIAPRASLAEGESSDIGLLYIHGGFGYGKTHLLNATALEAKKRGRRPLFLGAEDFMRQFLGALHRKDTLAFKDELRAADLLLIDDLQHICRSSATISEFLHTVNAFADQRRRVVIAADRPPTALESLGADVRSRLSGGLVIGLGKPDRDTRLAILKARAEDFVRQRPGAVLPQEVLERIADMDEASPRDLIGIFTKLATYADLTKKPVTLEVVEETVGQRGITTQKTSIEDIQRKTAEFYKLEMRDFHSPQRTRRVARPRQVAMYLARELTMRSLPEIGKRFGGRDHTTVLHACRRVAALCNEDPLFKQEVDFLKQVLSRRGEA